MTDNVDLAESPRLSVTVNVNDASAAPAVATTSAVTTAGDPEPTLMLFTVIPFCVALAPPLTMTENVAPDWPFTLAIVELEIPAPGDRITGTLLMMGTQSLIKIYDEPASVPAAVSSEYAPTITVPPSIATDAPNRSFEARSDAASFCSSAQKVPYCWKIKAEPAAVSSNRSPTI